MNLMQIHNLTVQFGGLRAVNDLSLDVRRGELLCLLGPNGAGKSTTLDLICGKTRATSGQIVFEGQDITWLKEYKRARCGIGRKFQVPSVFRELTVLENIELARSRNPGILDSLRVFRTPIRGRVREVLQIVGLIDMVDTRAGNLSHGQTQWLEIAMLLAQDSKLILMDEPTAGMTIQETLQTAAIFNSLKGDHTIIVVEHDMQFVRQVAERVIVMNQGSLLAEGTIAGIEADPRVKAVYLGH
ncbi:urea ABC transporter ATP-binding protein UrtD [Pseudogemmobacter humi]|uniref:Lipopolysaccharide export system ATP-binding protein LptB n=1 Tax=Pseudogemmobacter humi TaxID=2483812 RepID=A0A3P5XL86_9RHOB|nr:urea ABC transporter ATP-binding protein UrtD [Pseudogemmobacter humi]VDC28479.1 Lipopolysaccharide export system ATP-binding protein LptB [Pseudogemmobacter humi]